MVRALKTKTTRSLKKGDSAVLLPGPTGAEPWEVWILSTNGSSECIQTCATPLANPLRKNTTLALPISEVFCLPLWLNETDPKLFPEIIPLQLELRGLAPRGSGKAVFDYTVVTREGTRTLVVVGILPESPAESIQAEAYESFDLSARYLKFPEDALTLWQEQDHLVVAITRGPSLVYFQKLTDDRITQRLAQDLNCVRAILSMQEIVISPQQVVLWMKASPAEIEEWKSAMKLPVRQAERPSPKLPSQKWTLTPTIVDEAKRTREIFQWWKRGILMVLGVYLLGIVWTLSHFFYIQYQVNQLHQWQDDHAQSIALVRNTRLAWKELRPVVDESSYPLELLLQVNECIPTDQLHLTLFEDTDGALHIEGEATNVAAAFQFLDKLKQKPELAGYSWDMGQPTLLPNDLAKLRIEGKRETTN